MRAAVSEDYGSGPTIIEIDTPVPGPNEVRVKVRSSSLNGFDIALVRGYFKGIMPHRFPVVLGRDFAGTVDRVGTAVTAFAPGDEVFGVVLTQPLNAGGFAEYLVLPEDHSIAPMPAQLDHAGAGAIGLAGSSALTTVDVLRPKPGDTVFVSGATGGVGAFLLQLLAARGVKLIATAASDRHVDHVRALGATHTVDHSGDVGAQVRAIAPDGVDAVVHLAGDPAILAGLVADGGRFASLLVMDTAPFTERGITAFGVVGSPHRALLQTLAADVVSGALRIPVQRSYPLADVPRAVADFVAGKTGKLTVDVDWSAS